MVAVVGVPDDKWGEAVTAVIVPATARRPDADELISLVKAKKARRTRQNTSSSSQELPMTGVGKVDKKVLKASWGRRERLRDNASVLIEPEPSPEPVARRCFPALNRYPLDRWPGR